MKCKKCRHYYVRIVGTNGTGFNPSPSCWLYEDTGRRPNVLTQECYEPKRRPASNCKYFEKGCK